MDLYLIGYSGHAFVVIESALNSGSKVLGYFETEKKQLDPYKLEFLGNESIINSSVAYKGTSLFIGIGDNQIREKIYNKIKKDAFINIIDSTANVSQTAQLKNAIYVGKNACINALSVIGTGTIINTAAIVEHECEVGNFAHIAPGAVLCGNVKVGNNSFIGANSVVKQGVIIGDNVTIGAGSVVLKDVLSNTVAFGNPIKIAQKK